MFHDEGLNFFWRESMKRSYPIIYLLFLLSIFYFSPTPIHAEERIGLSTGQSIYVPAYSHIYTGNREQAFLLTVTISIRNIDPEHSIKITLC